jgi:hypothetical protein
LAFGTPVSSRTTFRQNDPGPPDPEQTGRHPPRLDVAPGTEGALALAGQNDHAAIAVPLGSTYGGHDPVCDLTVEGISIVRTSNRDTHFFAERLRLNNALSHFRSSPPCIQDTALSYVRSSKAWLDLFSNMCLILVNTAEDFFVRMI